MPKISDALRRRLMSSRIGDEAGVVAPTVKSSTSRMSERSISETSIDSVARLLQSRPHEVDRGQRDRKEHARRGRDPPGIDQVFAGIGDHAAKAWRRRLDAEPE